LIDDLQKELADIQLEKSCANSEVLRGERAAKMRQQELQIQDKLDQALANSGSAVTLLVTPELIARVVETWTGVPVSQMLESERQNLLNLENDLEKRW